MTELLVVAGEASGDRAAAAVAARLAGVRVFGLGGAALARAGVELVADFRGMTALGFGETAQRSLQIARAWRRVVRAARARRPDAALLVDYAEFNMLLAARLHAAGIPVVLYGAPQVWAWRPGRMRRLRVSVDRMAVVLPFEESMWRSAGVDARYVGHPALEPVVADRLASRRALGIPERATALGILPGSRPHEVRRLLPRMIEAWQLLAQRRPGLEARTVVAPSLDPATRRLLDAACAAHGLQTFEVDPMAGAVEILSAFDVVLCASGTASLEAALAHAPPVVTYRVGVVTSVVARALLRSPHIALPNVLLGRRAFAELVQREATAERMAVELDRALGNRSELLHACDAVAARMACDNLPSEHVARMLESWL
jgi:lipid-A-disaccharide synthase